MIIFASTLIKPYEYVLSSGRVDVPPERGPVTLFSTVTTEPAEFK